MIIGSIKDFMKSCPYLENGRININCLGGKSVRYSIDQVAAEPVIKKYCDGGALKQYRFVFAMRDAYDDNPKFCKDSAEFLDRLADWVSEQNRTGNLPVLKNERTIPESIEVVSSGHLYESSTDSQRLQLELRLIYRQEC